MFPRGSSLANLSKEINEDANVKEAVSAEKEYEELLKSRRRSARSSAANSDADDKTHAAEPLATKSKPKKRRALSKQESIAPKSSRSSRRPMPSHTRRATAEGLTHSLSTAVKPQKKQRRPQIYRTSCQYKKPSTLLRAPDFKSRYIVIDSHFKFMRIYRNEKELKNKEPFKYELPLKNAKIHIKDIQTREKCMLLTIKKQEHTFYFEEDATRENVVHHIERCKKQSTDSNTMNTTPQITTRDRVKSATNVGHMVNEYERQQSLGDAAKSMHAELNTDMLLELYAETDKGREIARWLNQNKTFLTVQQLQKLCDILRDKQSDHTFIQDFAAGQGLTYLCSISILRQHEWEILIMILDIFQIILNTRDVNDHEQIGYDLVREHSLAIQAIIDMFESKDTKVKCKVIRLCTILCMYDDAGFDAVIKGMYKYGERHESTSVFDEFVRSMYFEEDLEFRRDALKFVNAVLNLSPDLKRRIDSRHMLRELGFNSVLDQLWDAIAAEAIEENEDEEDSEHIHGDGDDDEDDEQEHEESPTKLLKNVHADKKNKNRIRYDESITVKHPLLREIREQLILYRNMKEEDDKKVLWEEVNLNDPEEIVRHLFKKAVQQKHISEFMQTLISMCTIPDHASALWGALPQLILGATGKKLKDMKLQMDGDQVIFEHKPHVDIEEEHEAQSGSDEEDAMKIFDDVEVLKERLNQAIEHEVQQEKEEIEKQIRKLNKKTEKLTHENIKLENEKIKARAKSASQQFKIDELAKDMKKIKNQLKETQAQLEETRVELESKSSPSIKVRSPLLAADQAQKTVAPLPMAPLAAPIPTKTQQSTTSAPLPAPVPAPLPGAPVAAPLPATAPMPAPLPTSAPAPKPAPIPGTAPKPAPIPAPAPLPGAAPLPVAPAPAPLPGFAPAPFPGAPVAAPLPGSAPIAAPLPGAAPLPTAAPLPAAAPLPGAPAPLPGAAPIAAPLPGAAPIPAAMPPPLPGIMPPPIPGMPPLPGNLPPPFAGAVAPPPMFKKKPKKKSPVPKPRKKMVPFHWKPIKKLGAKHNSIWSDIALDKIKIDIELNEEKPAPQSKKDEEDEKKDKAEDKTDDKTHVNLNIDELEKLFAKPEKKRKKKKASKSTKSKPKKPKREIISLLDDKRSYNMCIALNRFKMSNVIIRDSILALSEKDLNLDKIQKLMPIVPTAEEQEMFKNFDGEAADLDVADKFCYALRNIENLQERLRFWEFKMMFDELCNDERQRVNIYTKAHDTMVNSTSFQQTLQYVLIVGNYMNSGTKKGGVMGFNVESLLALANNKSADKSESLLSFIVKQIRKHNPSALDFSSDFVNVLPAAIKLDPELIRNAIEEIGKTLDDLYAQIKEDQEDKRVVSEFVIIDKENQNEEKKEQDEDKKEEDDVMEDMFHTKMASFYEIAQKQHKKLEAEFNDSQKKLFEYGIYLGQKNDETFEYMEHLLGFAQNVNKAMKTIKKKEMEEQLKKKREAAKKRKKEQRKLKEAKRKEDKQKKTKRTKASKLSSLAGAAFETKRAEAPVSAEQSLESKLNVLFAGGSLRDVGRSKTKRLKTSKTKPRPVTAEEKMHHKIEELPANFADDMLNLLSIDNIQKRRKSRFFDQAESAKLQQRKKPSKYDQLLGINEVDEGPVFKRQPTEFLIKKNKNKPQNRTKPKRKKRRRSKIGKLLGI